MKWHFLFMENLKLNLRNAEIVSSTNKLDYILNIKTKLGRMENKEHLL